MPAIRCFVFGLLLLLAAGGFAQTTVVSIHPPVVEPIAGPHLSMKDYGPVDSDAGVDDGDYDPNDFYNGKVFKYCSAAVDKCIVRIKAKAEPSGAFVCSFVMSTAVLVAANRNVDIKWVIHPSDDEMADKKIKYVFDSVVLDTDGADGFTPPQIRPDKLRVASVRLSNKIGKFAFYTVKLKRKDDGMPCNPVDPVIVNQN